MVKIQYMYAKVIRYCILKVFNFVDRLNSIQKLVFNEY